jgi:23S rRNA (guanosine2251-2'-O)-methyltransferase
MGPRDTGAPRPVDGPADRAAPLPPDVITGAHAVESLVRYKPGRVKEIFAWAAEPRLMARLVDLASEKGLRLMREPPPGIDPAAPNPQGVAVRVTPFEYRDLDELVPVTGAKPGTLVLALDSITDPRNLGAILRSAAFFEATAVVMPQDRAAEVTSLVERVAEGGSAVVPVVRVVNLARTLKALAERGVEVVGTALDGATGDFRDHRFGTATALVLGAEGPGIRPLVRKSCDVILTLAGPQTMPSLNVSAFATLALASARGAVGAGGSGSPRRP